MVKDHASASAVDVRPAPAAGSLKDPTLSARSSAKRDEFFRNTTSDLNGAAANQSAVANGYSGNSSAQSTVTTASNGGHAPPPPAAVAVHRVPQKAAPRQIDTYVGFDNIPNQIHRRAKKLGFEFNLMVVGQSGLGKSTFINSLFLSEVYNAPASRHIPSTVHVEERQYQMVEDNVTLNLSLVDTPGFGDQIDNSKCWEPLLNYIERKFNDYFVEENKVRRQPSPADSRVHACLYFITATGHGLKALDAHCMKVLAERVNVIPVIAKADTMTADELRHFKRTIHKEIDEKGVKIYKFPEPLEPDRAREQAKLKERVPFAVVGGTELKPAAGGGHNGAAQQTTTRCRTYPWGTVEIDNLEHNDFIALRDMLIRTHLIDMVDVTRNVHYENFRCRQMAAQQQGQAGTMGRSKGGTAHLANRNPLTALDDERNEHERAMDGEKARMENILSSKLREREEAMKKREGDLQRRQSELEAQVTARRQELDHKRALLKNLKEQYPQIAATVSVTALNGATNDGSPCSDGGGKSSDKVKRGKGGTLSGVFHRH